MRLSNCSSHSPLENIRTRLLIAGEIRFVLRRLQGGRIPRVLLFRLPRVREHFLRHHRG